MLTRPMNIFTDLRGAGNMTVDAVTGITDMVEALHHAIIRFPGAGQAGLQGRTRGITGFVYQNIRTVTAVVGNQMDTLLHRTSLMAGEKGAFPRREALLSVLNGVMGDYLAAGNNSLAIPMQFRRNGKPIEKQVLSEAFQQSNGRVVILVHGSCMNDLQWERKGHNHGSALAGEAGMAPLYLHYNSGLHISENGRAFSDLLETTMNQSPAPRELFIIAHSMGGLVSRSACHYANISGHTWLKTLQKIVFLGTPHHGAPLEKGGNWIDAALGISPFSAPFSRLGKIRSCGITDLRYGNVVDDDWQGCDRFERGGDRRTLTPLPEGVRCYAVAAKIGKTNNRFGAELIGDGLVSVSSALGCHRDARKNLSFPENRQWIGRGMNHLDLLSHPEVYETIRRWFNA